MTQGLAYKGANKTWGPKKLINKKYKWTKRRKFLVFLFVSIELKREINQHELLIQIYVKKHWELSFNCNFIMQDYENNRRRLWNK